MGKEEVKVKIVVYDVWVEDGRLASRLEVVVVSWCNTERLGVYLLRYGTPITIKYRSFEIRMELKYYSDKQFDHYIVVDLMKDGKTLTSGWANLLYEDIYTLLLYKKAQHYTVLHNIQRWFYSEVVQ